MVLLETQQWFDQNAPGWGFPPMLNLKDVSDKHGGFLVNDEVMVAVAVDVLEVVGSLDAPEKSESMDIKGFQVLPSQVIKKLMKDENLITFTHCTIYGLQVCKV